MNAFTPSPKQQAVFDWVKDGRGSAVLIAVAGAGKTTTIMGCLRYMPPRTSAILLAFNAAIAAELKGRLIKLVEEGALAPDHRIQARTFHSLGFGAVCKRLGMSPQQVQTDGGKLRKMCRDWLGDDEYEMYADYICKLVGLAKGQGIGALIPDEHARWWELTRHHDLFLDHQEATEERALELARELLQRSNKAAEQGSIDFDDQIYLPLLWRCRLWQNDWVFVDEAQDTNPVRRALAKLALRPGGRLLAVGDPRQAIYGFTGASHDAIDLIKREFNAIELPLTVSYRCAQRVVAKAQEIVHYIEAHDGAPQGSVETMEFNRVVQKLTPQDAVLCRNTAPLVSMAYQLLGKGIGCHVLGKEIGQGLINLIKKMRAKTVDQLENKLIAYRDREVSKFMARGEEGKAEAVADRVECVRICIETLDENSRSIPKLVDKMESLFSDHNGVLTLSTAHKAKGREWDQVAILRPELMPSKWARQDWQQVQEENLMYVAWTRAKRNLIFMTE